MDLLGIPQICVALLCYILLIYYLKGEKLAWNRSNITDTLPWILIHIHKLHHISVDLMERYNGTFLCPGTWLGMSDSIGTVDTANIHYITTSNFANYPKGDEYRKIFDVMGYALFNSDDEDWRYHRRLVHSPLKSRSYYNYSMGTAYEKLERGLVVILNNASKQNEILDIQDVFQRFTLDVTCKSITGHDPESLSIDLPNVPFLRALADFERGIIFRIALPNLLWKLQLLIGLGPETKLTNARGVISHYISNIVSNKLQEVTISKKSKPNVLGNNNGGSDLLTIILMKDDVTKTQGNEINENKFLQDTTLQQLIAGQDTISSALAWFVWLIVTHPRVEEKIRTEIRTYISGAKAEELRVFRSDETEKLVYLHATITETLRLYPPAPFQYKSPREPDVLPSGHRVHPKTKIIIPLYAMARMKAIWGDNCSKFEPERWITEQGTIKHEPSNKFFVFYAGPRSCMGKEAAMTQMKMVAATLIHNFRFQLVEGQNIEPEVSMFLNLKHGLKLKVYSRWSSPNKEANIS